MSRLEHLFVSHYADGRMPLSFTDAKGDRYYISYNQIGSPRAITDKNGNLLKTITYDSFGTIIADENLSLKIPFSFIATTSGTSITAILAMDATI